MLGFDELGPSESGWSSALEELVDEVVDVTELARARSSDSSRLRRLTCVKAVSNHFS